MGESGELSSSREGSDETRCGPLVLGERERGDIGCGCEGGKGVTAKVRPSDRQDEREATRCPRNREQVLRGAGEATARQIHLT